MRFLMVSAPSISRTRAFGCAGSSDESIVHHFAHPPCPRHDILMLGEAALLFPAAPWHGGKHVRRRQPTIQPQRINDHFGMACPDVAQIFGRDDEMNRDDTARGSSL